MAKLPKVDIESPRDQISANAGIESDNPAVTGGATNPRDKAEFLEMGMESREGQAPIAKGKTADIKNKNLDAIHSKYSKCIDTAVQAGRITKVIGQNVLAAENPEEAIANLVKNITRQKREMAIQTIRIAEQYQNIANHKSENAMQGLMSVMVKDMGWSGIFKKGKSKDYKGGQATYLNVDTLGNVYTKKYLASFGDSLSIFRTKLFGLTQDQKSLDMFVKAVYGMDVEDSRITKAAEDWLKIVDDMNNEFNLNGGSISKNENFLLPQNHDMRRIEKANYEGWRSFIDDKLNRKLMVDDQGRQLSEPNFEAALKQVYESITTGGLNKLKDFTVPNLGTKLARKGSDKRFLYFKDAESWMAYQNKFGKGDILTTLTDHIQNMSNDIALIKILGTNPRQTYEILKAQAQKLQLERNSPAMQNEIGTLDAVYKTISGEINNGQLTTLADGFQFVRNVEVWSKLGGAALSSVTDLATTALTANYNNMSATKVWARHLSLMNPANEDDKIFAARTGLIFDAWLGRAHGANRFVDTLGIGKSAKVAEVTLRMSGLEVWTDAGRKAFGMEFSAMLGDNFNKSFDELEDALKNNFKVYQITKNDWDNFRSTERLDLRGSKFADFTKDESMKFHSMVLSETDYAVPTPDARVRAIATGGLERGSFWGQMARSAMMIKSFPITMATTHLMRAASQSTARNKVMYIGSLAATTTVMGAFALQIKDIAAGREFRPMDSKEDWITAFVQGGSGSLFADFVISDVNKYGKGLFETAAGPMAGRLNDTWGVTVEAIMTDQENIAGKNIQYIRNTIPDPWPVQLIMTSMFDNIRLMAEPKYESTLRQIRTKRQKEFNQGYWWERGETPAEVFSE